MLTGASAPRWRGASAPRLAGARPDGRPPVREREGFDVATAAAGAGLTYSAGGPVGSTIRVDPGATAT